MHGNPILPENVVMKLVSNFASFLPYQYPIPIDKNTGNNTSNSFKKIPINQTSELM